jgi:hypothetical protein
MQSNRPPNDVQSRRNHARVEGVHVDYVLYTGKVDPTDLPVWGNVGDLYQTEDSLWYRNEDSWVMGVTDQTQHPEQERLVASFSRGRGKWINRTTLKTRATKSRGNKRRRSASDVPAEQNVEGELVSNIHINLNMTLPCI